MRLKIQHKIVLFSVLLGIFAGGVDTLVGYFVFSKGAFMDLLILNVPSQAFYVRTFLLLTCLAFGIVIARQVSREIELQNIIKQAKKEWEETFDVINDAITIHDKDFNIIRANKAASKLLRLPFRRILGQKCYQSYHGSGRRHEQCPACSVLETRTPCISQFLEPHLNRHLEIRAIPRLDRNMQLLGLVHVASDITKRVQSEDQLRSISLTDELTGLYNRRGFMEMASQQIKLANRTGQRQFLLYADMDNLKVINDRLGHQEGDIAIIEVSLALKENFRESDILARIGGDEFVVLSSGTDSKNIDMILSRFQDSLENINASRPQDFRLSVSVGVAYYDPERCCSVNDLLEEADRLMYEQKKKKRNPSNTARHDDPAS